jgi:hypothetical protein
MLGYWETRVLQVQRALEEFVAEWSEREAKAVDSFKNIDNFR